MTKTLIVGYDLNKAGQNYDKLIDALKSNYDNWWHYLDSTWLIKTTKTAVEVRDELQTFIDRNDELLVAELTGTAAWYGFTDRASVWLKSNL